MKTQQEIIKDHPLIFRSIKHLETEDGWNDFLYSVCDIIERHISHIDEKEQLDCFAVQIKSKFGGLRFYMSNHDPYISGVIDLAEKLSFKICEECGEPAKCQCINRWYVTVCDKHYQQLVNKYKT